MPVPWQVFLPCIADLLSGFVFYCAALTTGMRDARWFGTRAFAIGAAFVCSMWMGSVNHFWQEIAVGLAGVVIVGAAAWGTFTSGGRYRTQPTPCRAAVSLCVGTGIGLVFGIALMVIMSFTFDRTISGNYKAYIVTGDGEIAEQITRDSQTVAVNDLQGRPIEKYKGITSMAKITAGVVQHNTELWLGDKERRDSYRSTSPLFNRLSRPTTDYYNGPNSWFYVRNLGLIAKYSNRSGQLLGWIGPDGYSAGPTPPRRFPGEVTTTDWYHFYNYMPLFSFPDSVYRIDLESGHVEKAFEAAPGEQVLDSASGGRDSSALLAYGERAGLDVIATDRRVIVLSGTGEQIVEVPHDPRALEYPTLRVSRAMAAPGEPVFVWYEPKGWGPDSRKPDQVTEYQATLPAPRHYSLPKPPFEPGAVNWTELLIPMPVIPLTVRTGIEIAKRLNEFPNNEPWSNSRAALALSWIIPGLSSLVSALLAYRRGRKYAFPSSRLMLWSILSFAAGPVGYLSMLGILEWPALETCPSCGHKRIVTSERCEHCKEPFAPPAMDGTEIFEF
jgi:hypothetical protein